MGQITPFMVKTPMDLNARSRADNDSLRILAISARADIGGGPEQLYQLTQALAPAVQTTIACPDDAPYADRFRGLQGVPQVITIPHRAFHTRALWQLIRHVQAGDFHIIHSHGKGAGLYSRSVAAMTGVPCVHTFHGLHIDSYGLVKRQAYLSLERAMGSVTQAIIAVSQGEAKLLGEARLFPDHKLHIIENGVEISEIFIQRDYTMPMRVLSVSRFNYQKNTELCLDIAAHLKEADAKVQIQVIGSGECFEACHARILHQSLGGFISLVGATNKPREFMQKADVLLSTSRWEGLPLAVLEAMSEGVIPVLSDVVGNRDTVAGGELSQLLFVSGHAREAATLLMALADCPPPRLKYLSALAREHVKSRYSATRMAANTLALYEWVRSS